MAARFFGGREQKVLPRLGLFGGLALLTMIFACSGGIDRKIQELKSPDPAVRRQALVALATLKNPRVSEPLIQVLQKDPDGYCRVRAAFALGEFKNLSALPSLITAYQKDPNPFVKEGAIIALGAFPPKDTNGLLLKTLQGDKDPRLRAAAARALGRQKEKDSLNLLLQALKDEDQEVRKNVAAALGDMGQKEAVPPLMESLLGDDDKGVRAQAALSLGLLGDVKAVRALFAVQKDQNPELRQNVAWALENLSEKVDLKTTLMTLHSEIRVLNEKMGSLQEEIKNLREENKKIYSALGGGAEGGETAAGTPAKEVKGTAVATVPKAAKAGEGFEKKILADLDKFKYVGLRGCRCHFEMKEGEIYKERKHSQAFKRLVGKEKEDPNCLRCHATAYGKKIMDGKPYLKDNQCEACHGPGELYQDRALKELYRTDPLLARKKSLEVGLVIPGINVSKKELCARCHWDGKDPKAQSKCPKSTKVYNYKEYYDKMKHTKVDPIDKIIVKLSPEERKKWAPILPVPEE